MALLLLQRWAPYKVGGLQSSYHPLGYPIPYGPGSYTLGGRKIKRRRKQKYGVSALRRLNMTKMFERAFLVQ
jgi:hypothetical protein